MRDAHARSLVRVTPAARDATIGHAWHDSATGAALAHRAPAAERALAGRRVLA